jgi:uncharacterized repeat protein (TIGR03803 family)
MVAALLAYSAAGIPAQPVLYSQLHSFTNSLPDGNQPLSISMGPDGVIYGVTFGGGTNANPGGTIFKVNRDGSGYAQLHSFDAATTGNSNGVASVSAMTIPQYGGLSLTLSREGILYGTTWMGGANNQGTVFKLNRDGSGFATIRDFGPSDAGPVTLMQGNDGALYGTTWRDGIGAGTIFRLTTDGNNYTVLYTFTSTDGFLPVEPLMQARDGLLYGSLYLGTSANQFGTIFKINPADHNYTVLRHLGAADGFHPTRLIQMSDGNLYGTIITGPGVNHGAIFQMDTNGDNFALLHVFTNVLDGSQLHNGVVEGPGNMLYGVAESGGSGTGGTLYQFHVPSGTFNVIYNFTGGQLGSGMQPLGALVLGDFSGSGGIIFGTATFGGATQGSTGYNGVVFSLVVSPPLTVTPTTTPNSSGPTTIFWPAWAQNYVLQTSTNVADPNSWTTVNATNLQVIGVTVTNGAPGAYYRLAYPTF